MSKTSRVVAALRMVIARARKEPAILLGILAISGTLGLPISAEALAGALAVATIAVRAVATVTESKEDDSDPPEEAT